MKVRVFSILVIITFLGCSNGQLSSFNFFNCTTCGGGGSPHKRVFATAGTFNGNMGGYAGANNICQTAANTAGLGGTWIAWVSTSVSNINTRLIDVSPWYLVDGTTLAFSSYPTAVSLMLVNMTTEFSGVPGGFNWTGTDANGLYTTYDCIGWTSPSGGQNGMKGHANIPASASWTANGGTLCSNLGHLYCFEQ